MLPTCGTKFYRYNGGWEKLYAEDLAATERTKIIAALQSAVDRPQASKPTSIGATLSKIAVAKSPFQRLGQEAPLEEKKKWDPDFAKRKQIQPILEKADPGIFRSPGRLDIN